MCPVVLSSVHLGMAVVFACAKHLSIGFVHVRFNNDTFVRLQNTLGFCWFALKGFKSHRLMLDEIVEVIRQKELGAGGGTRGATFETTPSQNLLFRIHQRDLLHFTRRYF